MTTIALIPARIGSKGVPRKNIRIIGGQELIAYTIQAAREAPNVDAVWVTTESPEIAEVARRHGAQVLMRPEELSQDHVQSDEVYLYCLRQLELEGIRPKCLVLLQPTSPFRTWRHIERAVELWHEMDGEFTIVSGFRAHGFFWANDDDDEFVPVLHNPMRRLGRQDVDEREWLIKENGSIYCVSAEEFSRHRCYRLPPFHFYLMKPEDSVDIDTEDDWKRAVEMMEERQ